MEKIYKKLYNKAMEIGKISILLKAKKGMNPD